MPGPRPRASLAAAAVLALVALFLAAGPATAASSPSPSLPRPTDIVDPALSVGGPALAPMRVIVDRPAGVPAPPRVRDASWLIADADTGAVLAAKAPHALLLPASTAKVLTALTLLPRIDPKATHTTTRAEAGADGTRVGLVPGMTYTAHQLFLAMLMASANDAAYALADMNGGHATTLAQMNALAATLGAHDTLIGDPAGLDAPGQTSSAYDLALLGRAALENPDFRAYSTTRTARFPTKRPKATPGRPSPTPSGPRSYQVQNHNQLLRTYPGTIGVKNGFTEAAQRTNIAAATRGGHTYIVTEMHSIDYGWTDPPKLLDWAFAHGTEVTPVGRLVEPGEVPVAPAATPTASASPAAGLRPAPVAAGAAAGRGPLVSVSLPDGSTPYAVLLAVLGGGAVLVAALLRVRARRARHRS
jgi:D-alanyl-D-alanine carboxypeptidase (penicillin-binding protein 5/6)